MKASELLTKTHLNFETEIMYEDGFTTLKFGDTGFEIDIYGQDEQINWSGRFDAVSADTDKEIVENSLKYVYGIYLFMLWMNDGDRFDDIEPTEYVYGDTNVRMHKSRQALFKSLDKALDPTTEIYEQTGHERSSYFWKLNVTPLMYTYNKLLENNEKEDLMKIKFFRRLYHALEVFGDGGDPQPLWTKPNQ